MIKVDIVEKPDFPKMEKRVSRTFDNSTVKLVALGAKYMRSIVPYKTGKLKHSIRHDKKDIWSVADHFKYVDEGTKPHRIEGLLVFYIHGIQIFSRGVDHPGTKPQYITDRTVKYIEGNIKGVVRDIDRVTQ